MRGKAWIKIAQTLVPSVRERKSVVFPESSLRHRPAFLSTIRFKLMAEYTTAYQDQNGRPQLRQSTVAFFDIPSPSDAWTSSAAAIDSQHLLDRIVAAIEDSRDFVRQSFPDSELAKAGHCEVRLFSEILAFGNPFDRNVADPAVTIWSTIRCAQRYQLRMALSGYFLRGVLTQGAICLTDEIIFGNALVEYCQLKSKASIVPRVILTEPLRQLVHKPVSIVTDQTSIDARDSIYRDVDGWWFLNYLAAAWEGAEVNWALIEHHKESILKSFSSTTRDDVLPKFDWVCRYHNLFCQWHRDAPGYLDRYGIACADEESIIVRLSDAASWKSHTVA